MATIYGEKMNKMKTQTQTCAVCKYKHCGFICRSIVDGTYMQDWVKNICGK